MRFAALVLLLLIDFQLQALAQGDSAGERLYKGHCASCHGVSGNGDGWLAKRLTRRTPALTSLTRRFGGTFPAEMMRHTIDGRRDVEMHGPREMPVWGQVFMGEDLAGERTDALMEYLRSVQQ